jgi:hypothetical protein
MACAGGTSALRFGPRSVGPSPLCPTSCGWGPGLLRATAPHMGPRGPGRLTSGSGRWRVLRSLRRATLVGGFRYGRILPGRSHNPGLCRLAPAATPLAPPIRRLEWIGRNRFTQLVRFLLTNSCKARKEDKMSRVKVGWLAAGLLSLTLVVGCAAEESTEESEEGEAETSSAVTRCALIYTGKKACPSGALVNCYRRTCGGTLCGKCNPS